MTEDIVYFPFSCEIKYTDEITPLHLITTPVFDRNKGSQQYTENIYVITCYFIALYFIGSYGCQISWDPGYSSLSTINNSQSFSLLARSGSLSTDTQSIRLMKSAKYQPEIVALSPPPATTASIDISATKEVLKQLKVILSIIQ